jgi:hypothetical protein
MDNTVIAKNILEQLGGNKFVVMTGAKNFVVIPNGLSFRIPRAGKGIQYVKIKLNAMDTYDVEFGKLVKYEYKLISKYNGIYFDGLRELFEKETGLYTSLGTLGGPVQVKGYERSR